MNFDFWTPTRLVTGEGCVAKNAQLLKALGDKCLIVTGGSSAVKSGALDDVLTALKAEGIAYIIHDSVEPNPLLDDAYSGGKKAAESGADFVIGIGGGSPIDAAKAVAVFGANPSLGMLDIFTLDWKNRPLPIVAIGTTAGTGTEVNGFSVMTKPDGRKQSISHILCYPTIAFGDFAYTRTLPLSTTVSTALDALSHAIEGYFSTTANKYSDMYAVEAVSVLGGALGELTKIHDMSDIGDDLRERLYYASVTAGVTLGHCGTAYCHALGYFLTEEHDIPHGIACAVFLDGFIDRQKQQYPEKAARMERITGASMEELTALIRQLRGENSTRVSEEKLREIVDSKEGTSNFTRTGPAGITQEEGYEIMRKAFS